MIDNNNGFTPVGRFFFALLLLVFAVMLVVLPTLRHHGVIDRPTTVGCPVTEHAGCGHP